MAKALRGTAFLIIGVAFVAGIIARESIGSMLLIWIAGGVSAVFTFAFAQLLESTEYMAERLYDIQNHLNSRKDA